VRGDTEAGDGTLSEVRILRITYRWHLVRVKVLGRKPKEHGLLRLCMTNIKRQRQTSNINHQPSTNKYQTSNIKHQTSNTEHQTPNVKR
jgi:hypothetical protein